MKKLLLCVTAFVLVSCNSNTKTETGQLSDSSSKTKSVESIESNGKDTTTSTSSYIIRSKEAGPYKIGNALSSLDTKEYQLIKTKEIRSTDEGQEEVPLYLLIKGKDKILSAYPEYDYGKSAYSDKIGEMRVYSPEFHTEKNISPVSKLSDILKSYPNVKIMYTYISNTYWAETADLEAVQFILNGDDFTGDKNAPVESEIKELKKSDFSETAEVMYVRFF